MSAYLVVFISARNTDWLTEYMDNVPGIIHSKGGKYISIAKMVPDAVKVVEGSASAPQSIVIFEFPSMDAITAFVDGPEYAPFKKSRIAATESNFFAFENDEIAPQFAGQ